MGRIKNTFAILLILVASDLSDIIFRATAGYVPAWLPYAKLALIAAFVIVSLFANGLKPLAKYAVVLAVITAARMFTDFLFVTPWWQSAFDSSTFTGNFGGAILLKLIGIIPVLIVLLLFYRSFQRFYLVKGDLSAKADKIAWLGIKKDQISWGRLSILSAVLISSGTLVLTLVTVTGFSFTRQLGALPGMLPAIVGFALVNAFCEGVVFRSAVLGALKDALPKGYAILTAAVYFGIAHYYGAPGGILGVVMSGMLGWYMLRSMYETKGFAASWIIHFLQDVVIFSSIYLLGGFS